MKPTIFIVILAVLMMVTQFQNCGDMGGNGLSGIIGGSSTCKPGTSGCEAETTGDPSKLAIAITSGTNIGTTKYISIGLTATDFSIDGSCDNGGFSRTLVSWELHDGATVIRSGRSDGCTES